MNEVKSNLLDRVIGTLAPELAVRRLVARQKLTAFNYDGAQSTRARGNPPPLQASESSRNQRDRIQLMKATRDLSENVGFVKSILLKVATYVCGTLRYQARTGDRALDDQIETYLEKWMLNCDITGRHTLRELVQLALISMLRDGDMGFICVSENGEPFKLQSIESDRIGGIYDASTSESYFGGITINKNGTPVSYRIFERTVFNSYVNPREIPAASFIHFFDSIRLDQYRGVTAFHACVNTLRDIYEILDYEKQSVKWASSLAGIITNDSGSDDTGYNFDTSTQDPNGNTLKVQSVEPGAITYLSKGEDIKTFMSDRPSATFSGFIQALYREVSLSLNLPYGFVYDMSNLSGPTARLESAQAQRAFHRLQVLLEDKVLNRIKNRAILEAIGNREIPNNENCTKGKWMFPAHPTIDVGRESAANLNENRQGLKTAADIYAEQGKDWEEEQYQLANEAANIIRLAKLKNVPVDMIQMLTPNGNPDQNQSQPEKTVSQSQD